MKQFLSVLLVAAALLGLTACSIVNEVPEVTSFQPPEEPVSGVITTVDDFLAAIKPGAEIVLGEGDFLLHRASDYGNAPEDACYVWKDLGLGQYELEIQYVRGLTIRGAGKGRTNLITDARFANVLSVNNCRDIELENMTLGHREMTEACEGGVIRLEDAREISLEGLGLYGCGTVGVNAYDCDEIAMEDCEVYECSSAGVSLSQCRDVEIEKTVFHSLGKDMPVQNIFGIWNCYEVEISQCRAENNYVHQLVTAGSAGQILLQENQFSGNQIATAAFDIQAAELILDRNTFEGETPRNWYSGSSGYALDPSGREITFEESVPETAPAVPGEPQPVSTGEQKQVKVKNIEQFLDAIGPDTCIILNTKLLDLSKAKSYQKCLEENPDPSTEYRQGSDYYYWRNNYDGPSLVIIGVSNLTIMAEGEDRTGHTISAVPRYADVLTFENCDAITLSGFTAGHTKEQGQCTGGVFRLENSENVLIDNCGMYGCGTEGVSGDRSRNIQVVNCEIYECSYTGIELFQCDTVAISGTIIRDIENSWQEEAPFFQFYDSKNVTLDGLPLDGNYVGR